LQLALRHYVTSGIALVGASVIAITPVQPVPSALSDMHVPAVYAADVQLAAVLNPFEVFAPIVGQAVSNAQVIGQKVLENPMPILRALALNQLDGAGTLMGLGMDVGAALAAMVLAVPGNIQTAIGLLQAGQVDQALKVVENGFVSPFIPLFMTGLPKLIEVLKQPLIDAQVLLDTLPSTLIVGVGFPLLNTAYGLQTQIVNGITAVVAALGTGNPEAVVNAIITGAANFTQELLNGNPANNTYGLLGIYGAINGFLDARTLAEYFLRPPAEFAARATASTAAATTLALAVSPDTTTAAPAPVSSVSEEGAAGGEAPETSEPAETPAEASPAVETAAESPVEETPVEETPTAETPVEETPVDSEPSVDDDTAGSGNGATDLSGGNKVTPGQTPSGADGSDSDNAETDAPESPADDESAPSGANSGAATGTDSGSNSDNSGSSDSGDSGSDSNE
jgi:hypothetical protein